MDHHWHYDYARLAWDTGFVFGNKNPSYLDKNKLSKWENEKILIFLKRYCLEAKYMYVIIIILSVVLNFS